MHASARRQVLATMLICLAGIGTAAGQVIGFWEFDEKSPGNYASTASGAILDSSGQGNHLTAIGSVEVPFYVEGSPAYDSGSSLNFLDPDDDRLEYEDPNGSTFDFAANESFTIEAVIGSLVQPDTGAIVAKDGNAPSEAQWWFRHENGALKFLIADGTAVNNVNTGTNPLAKINDGAWHHVAAVRDADAGVLRLYVDYQLMAEEADTTTGDIDNNTNMTIGGFANSTSREFGPGDIDFVKITVGALTPDQFEQMLPETTATLAYWDFEEGVVGTEAAGTAGEILDISGNNRHATAIGDPNGFPLYVDGQCLSKALQFDAEVDAVAYPYSAPYPFDMSADAGMTFELVIRTSATGIYQGLISRDAGGSQYWSRIKDDQTLQFFVSDGSGNGLDVSDPGVNDGAWHHVAFVRDGRLEQLRTYVDGVLVGRRGEPTAGDVANTAPLTIAEFVSSSTRSFVGEIDLVRVSSGALAPENFVEPCPVLQADFDGDYDVDLDDLRVLQEEFTGPR